jgi:hypothetical protein
MNTKFVNKFSLADIVKTKLSSITYAFDYNAQGKASHRQSSFAHEHTFHNHITCQSQQFHVEFSLLGQVFYDFMYNNKARVMKSIEYKLRVGLGMTLKITLIFNFILGCVSMGKHGHS